MTGRLTPRRTLSSSSTTTTTTTTTSLPLPDFTNPSFDPAEYLNQALPQLTITSPSLSLSSSPSSFSNPAVNRGPPSSATATSSATGTVSLSDLSTQIQSLLSRINAQNVRLSNTLTQLTDEILRSGGRLAYEVEVLRGETIALSDTLTERLRGDVERFSSVGVDHRDPKEEEGEDEEEAGQGTRIAAAPAPVPYQEGRGGEGEEEPEFIVKLRTLNQVRARLEDVVHIFGQAMEWPLPPSELSLTSSFISVSAPEPSGTDSQSRSQNQSREEKGQEMFRKFRKEVSALLQQAESSDEHEHGGGRGGHVDVGVGVEAAARRVEALRTLASVWKGSAEEKARTRFVDSLAKMVDDRRRALEQQQQQQQQRAAGRGKDSTRADSRQRGTPAEKSRQGTGQNRDGESSATGGVGGGGAASGLLRNLQRLRDEIYLE